MRNPFSDLLQGKVVIVGIGNPLKGDDGCGPALIEQLAGRINAVCIDAGNAPENYTGKIIKENPTNILIVDAVHLERSPGSYELVKKEEIAKIGLTTHDMGATLLIGYLEQETKANIYLLGIQPQSVSFGEGISSPVQKSIEEISKLMKEAGHA